MKKSEKNVTKILHGSQSLNTLLSDPFPEKVCWPPPPPCGFCLMWWLIRWFFLLSVAPCFLFVSCPPFLPPFGLFLFFFISARALCPRGRCWGIWSVHLWGTLPAADHSRRSSGARVLLSVAPRDLAGMHVTYTRVLNHPDTCHFCPEPVIFLSI